MTGEDQSKILAEIRDAVREHLEHSKHAHEEYLAANRMMIEQLQESHTTYRTMIEKYDKLQRPSPVHLVAAIFQIILLFTMIVSILWIVFGHVR